MRKIDDVLKAVILLEGKEDKGVTASEVGEYLNLDRANVSRYLNKLYKENKIKKIEGRPVLYKVGKEEEKIEQDIKIIENDKEPHEERLGIEVENSLDNLVGANQSLQIPIQQAKAAILYPPSGLHTLILGETGVGKSMFAEAMYFFAKESHVLNENSPFVRFNCADYADNPQLVIAQIFGVKKGAFTGADRDKDGLLKKADGGILFLDEIHRLSPQGQEMLFTFIDKGVFRPLGETEKQEEVRVQIIAATTEDPKSYLLQTFTRRIPMTIVLPPLRERTIEERYDLLEEFIKSESLRLKESIYINKNALISFLLYDCPNNIGQLKSDIQLSCAKAFLNYKFNKKKYIIIEQSDLQSIVKKGIMKLKENRDEINRLFDGVEDVLRFSYKENLNNKNLSGEKKEDGESFYETIENKIDSLKGKGVKEEEITDILNVDIEEYFRKYMKNLKGNFRKDEILKIVDSRIVDIVEKILAYASEKLGREYDDKVYYGLALHLQGSIERIINGNKIYHPKLNSIRAEYNREFIIAMNAVKMIEDEFGVQVSLDEIGYITMFLAADSDTVNKKDNRKVGVLVIMHGASTASSMAEVANTLIGEQHVEALDMPLSMKAEDMFENVKKKTKEIDRGKGVLILADMGSLVNFGEILKEELNIKIKTVDMVSTLSVIEAGRKALSGRDLESIYQSCVDINKYGVRSDRKEEEEDKKEIAIVTTCFTGEGSAERLKKIIGEKLHNIDNVNIISLDILDKEKFFKKLQSVRRDYIVAAIVGTVNMFVEDIPFISAAEVFTEKGIERLDGIVDRESDFNKICESLKTQIKGVNCYNLVNDIRTFINNVENSLDMKVEPAAEIGILMHVSFLVDKLRNKGKETMFNGLNEYRAKHNKDFIMVKRALKIIEVDYNINIGDDEIAYIVKMILNNRV
ncbi:sigma 54-interacting transcriptional regulator [Clostridium sp. LIBA-8841]|uniref:sigma 54-interacting transcriptional regulator n=1 Tax=Clostridium sp. LIBA-8841 TaxID=2987530 RepID=UPI002AC52808|nr:sigma 54-interacting transcriptional regulator [Clostridium sp. LIBA-8841]MDZ5254772.1 sigma 54-interacting transcriptional regulator [Clostridium sp. LIBA-8841]